MVLWKRGGKRKESLQPRLWNLNSTSNFPVDPRQLSCQISANQREAETRERMQANLEKHVPRVMTSLLMSFPPISTLHRLFQCRCLNSRDVVASCPFPAPPPEHPRELARRLLCMTKNITAKTKFCSVVLQYLNGYITHSMLWLRGGCPVIWAR